MRSYIQSVQESVPIAQKGLLERGWCITFAFTNDLIIQVADALKASNIEQVDSIMATFVRHELETVEAALHQRFPGRKPVLSDAFDAHRAGKYNLSVPVFLSQADGIGCEVLGLPRQFFPEKTRKTALAAKLASLTVNGQALPLLPVQRMLVEQISMDLSITEDTTQVAVRRNVDPWFGPLNRHAVLHGHDVEYGNEMNSLRCVLYLHHLFDVDEILNNDSIERMAKLSAAFDQAMKYYERNKASAQKSL